jgi:hypothetical protein
MVGMMNTMVSAAGTVLMAFGAGLMLFCLVVAGFVALDRWHRRKAWRDADRMAREYMRRRQAEWKGPPGAL